MLFKNKLLQYVAIYLAFGIYTSCRTPPIVVLSKNFTTNQYISPTREANIMVFDYSCVFIANKSSSQLHFTNVLCNNKASKMFLLNTKNEIISEFNEKDTVLLRASVLRNQQVSKFDSLTIFYHIKGREKKMSITNFTKIDSPINQ